jgi:hypothetical protein
MSSTYSWGVCIALIFCFFTGTARAQGAGITKPAKGNAFNPDISANFLGLFLRGTNVSDDRNEARHNGLSLQEAEIQFTADVDPYLRASALLAIAQEEGGTEYAAEPEEVFLETISLPGWTLRAGKFKLALGKHNQLHAHAFPFIDAPLIHQRLLGEEGLNENAVSASYLVPVNWFSEIQLQAFSLTNEEVFASPRSGDTGGLAHLKNLWDFSDDLTMELGLSGVVGKNFYDENTSIFGADLTFKWRPSVGGKYQALIWSSEYLAADKRGFIDESGEPQERLSGWASWVQYQFAERWWVQARVEQAGLAAAGNTPRQDRQSALIGFFPSEFSGLRLQYDHENTEGRPKTDHVFSLQYNISIGAHPAHAY